MPEVICFGEMMLRLSPEGVLPLREARKLEMVYGGAEANVGIALAGFGRTVGMVTTFPDNPLGQACRGMLASYGVDVSHITMKGDRMGLYFMEKGSAMRPSRVVYDRKGSAFAVADPACYDWAAIFEGAQWFVCTGITPALGENTRTALLDAARAAKAAGVQIACDINFRRNLWSGAEAGAFMEKLLPLCDVVITNADQVEDVLGWREADDLALARRLCATYGLRVVAMTGRDSRSADDNVLTGAIYLVDEDRWYASGHYPVHPIVDRIGGGDAFTAGMLYGLLTSMPRQQMVEFATAADAYKHTIPGDAMFVPVEDIMAVAKGDLQGRVRR